MSNFLELEAEKLSTPPPPKKIVRFRTDVANFIQEDFSALVIPYDHPDFDEPDQFVDTSTVLKIFPDGSFETLNTLYVPA